MKSYFFPNQTCEGDLMKRILTLLSLLACSYNHIYSMDDSPSDELEMRDYQNETVQEDPEQFTWEYADSIQNNYDKLFPYFAKHVDKIDRYVTLIRGDVGRCIKSYALGSTQTENSNVKSDVGGNVVALYYFVRNHIKKQACRYKSKQLAALSRNENFSQNLFAMLLCLQCVAFDVINHYIIHRDPSVFNTYTIFKKKFHYLYTHFLPRGWSYAQFPDFNTVCKETINYWKRKDWHKHRLCCEWVKSFNWYYPNIKGCYSLYFGPCNTLEGTTTLSNKEIDTIFLFVENIFTNIQSENQVFSVAKSSSWSDFFEEAHYFKSFAFPYSKEDLDKAFPQ